MESKKLALVSEKMPNDIALIFENLGYGCVRLPSFEQLDAPVAHHPDMLFSRLDNGKLLCDGRYISANPQLLELGIDLAFSVKRLGKKYPYDIAFDALIFDGTVYGSLEHIAPEILNNRKTVGIRQGYALCSTLVTDVCAVTADDGIYLALKKNGAHVLKISAGGITLDGYNCGFIGGASCFDPMSNTVVFFGNLSVHPDYKAISDFLENHGHKIAFSKDFPLSDFGGAKLIDTKNGLQ